MSLTHAEARERSALIAVQSYDVLFELDSGRTFRSRSEVTFACRQPGTSTFIELTNATAVTVTLNGERLPAQAYSDQRITLPALTAANTVVVEATLPYVNDGEGMHRFDDPADGATYICAFGGMDATQRIFACFNQPDLKATVHLAVRANTAWSVLANGAFESSASGLTTFSPTPPISPYLFTMCAGPWHSVRFEHAGISFGWHARASLGAQLDRDADELREVTTACFDHYTTIFDEPYAFGPYDQVMVPGLNWGAMESPGCITFRDELLFRGQATDAERGLRAEVIAHEMAHMWFGDLVTMRWWDDSWLSESFADYMGFQVSAAVTEFDAAWLRFSLGLKGFAYRADERRSTHPVAPDPGSVPDVDTAIGIFDSISYGKGNSALRQLVTWLGEDEFLAGVNAYLSQYRFGNASLDDLIDALDTASTRDVRGWAQSWLRTTGFDTLRVGRDGDVPVISREGDRQHRTRIAAYTIDNDRLREVSTESYEISQASLSLPQLAGLAVIPNSHDETFARVLLDPLSWGAVRQGLSTIEDKTVRAVVWSTAFDMVASSELTPTELLDLVAAHLPSESHASIVERVIDRLGGVLSSWIAPDALAQAHRQLASTFDSVLDRASDASILLAATRARVRSASTNDVGMLEDWLRSERTSHGVDVEADLRWRIVGRLAELGAIDEQRIGEEAQRDKSTQGEQGSARALAAQPTAEAKAVAWEALFGRSATDSNRTFEARAKGFWSAEHADLVAPYVGRYLDEAPSLATRSQGVAQQIGDAFPVHAATPETVKQVRTALAAEPPTVLRRIWEDRLDDLERSVRIRQVRR
ncbi:aminopeptidase N [Luteipulveratus mongoliensis]|uniref:Aminopeptidase N n=1 Tax=Luteipulveratus mongoliensis TaxID=571913 RepID=A0A0K1JE25_9MICO|nr:aminopeptidase N [Luteipulveratus mongoliensis]AKU14843.1 hypothetical protein VV02_01440 [Luteipulveratus mongoliensis]